MGEVIKGMTEGISPRQFLEADGVRDWRVLGEGACAYFRTGSFEAGATSATRPRSAMQARRGSLR